MLIIGSATPEISYTNFFTTRVGLTTLFLN